MKTTNRTILGCESIPANPPRWFSTKRLGLLANHASVDGSFTHVMDRIRAAGGRLACLFSPQHGFDAEKQANMCESAHSWEGTRKLHIFSLYGEVRKPTAEMLEHIDVLIIDLQDVGTRVYTYGTTMGLCLEACAETDIKVVILDRPNPIGGKIIEGNLVQPDHFSFVGRYALPMRHGLTMGELARFIVAERRLSCDLEVVPLIGWKRDCYYDATGLTWIFPSPNMPTWETALLYPGMVLFEGTNISEGRGTTLPFHLCGAPFIHQQRLLECLSEYELPGVFFRPVSFEPVFDKWQGKPCFGFQVHVVDHRAFRPYRTGLALLQAITRSHPDHFRWLPPPYEYETEKLPIDILIGNGDIRRSLECGKDIKNLEDGWSDEMTAYREKIKAYTLYTSAE